MVIRILLAYRGALSRGAVAAVLSAQTDMEVVAEPARCEQVVPGALRTRPDVVVIDHALPGGVPMSDLSRTLCRVATGCRVLVVLDRRSGAGVGRALVGMMPRVGLIGTEATPMDLVTDIRRLARGDTVLAPELAVAALQSVDTVLTDREREVLHHARLGATAKEIARCLCLSPGTVRNYLSRVLTKTGARTRIEAIRIAQDAGWI